VQNAATKAAQAVEKHALAVARKCATNAIVSVTAVALHAATSV